MDPDMMRCTRAPAMKWSSAGLEGLARLMNFFFFIIDLTADIGPCTICTICIVGRF